MIIGAGLLPSSSSSSSTGSSEVLDAVPGTVWEDFVVSELMAVSESLEIVGSVEIPEKVTRDHWNKDLW